MFRGSAGLSHYLRVDLYRFFRKEQTDFPRLNGRTSFTGREHSTEFRGLGFPMSLVSSYAIQFSGPAAFLIHALTLIVGNLQN